MITYWDRTASGTDWVNVGVKPSPAPLCVRSTRTYTASIAPAGPHLPVCRKLTWYGKT